MQRIEAPRNIRSLCWLDDQLIDWASGGQILRLDGTIEDANVIYGYRFDEKRRFAVAEKKFVTVVNMDS